MSEDIGNILDRYKSGGVTRAQAVAEISRLKMPGGETGQSRQKTPFRANGTNHVALAVTDLERSRDFYSGLLGMPVQRETDRYAFLELDYGFLALFRRDEPGMGHFCLSVDYYDPDRAQETLESRGLEVRRPDGSGRVYFRDPDNIEVQLSQWEFKSVG